MTSHTRSAISADAMEQIQVKEVLEAIREMLAGEKAGGEAQ
jgi:hypothetical protein